MHIHKDKNIIVVIGRGHSGTRVASEVLHKSGVFMGSNLNKSYDLIPPQHMYYAAKYVGQFVKSVGVYEWDFSYFNKKPDKKFVSYIEKYLKEILENKSKYRGWKLPETTLVYPWLVKMFPNIKYIIWHRHPYDSIFSSHKSDNLRNWKIKVKGKMEGKASRAVSWKYQYDIVKMTPLPKNIIHVKYEDFIMNPKREAKRLKEFLGFKLSIPKLYKKSVEKWRKNKINKKRLKFLNKPMSDLGYRSK